ncbi:hypothetical protein AB1L42_22460 [Thalassoglobus sp. JC818]|uniref:hypothetical protein n=1 Tax=Thalassoglobus sp. JC818 TaxID=3232136 RepID=UPI00345759FA
MFSPSASRLKNPFSTTLKQFLRQTFSKCWPTIDSTDAICQARYDSGNFWSQMKVEEKLDDRHENPVRAGFDESATDWPWSSARWYLQRRTVGVPIQWPPGLETSDDFVVG